MRLLHVTPNYYPELKFGGPPQKIRALVCGLKELGHDVNVITFHSEQPRSRTQTLLDGVRVQYLPWIGYGLRQCPTSIRLMRDAIRASDVVHCYGLYNLLFPIAAHLACRTGLPYFLEPLGMY